MNDFLILKGIPTKGVFVNDMPLSHRRLFIAIIVQAMKDYYQRYDRSEDLRLEVRNWVNQRNGIFDLCAASMNSNPVALAEMLKEKMKAIDRGEGLYKEGSLLSHREVGDV